VRTEVVAYEGGEVQVLVDMGPPRFRPDEIPVRAAGDQALSKALEVDGMQLEVACVGMGNPHAVAFVESVDDFPLSRIGPLVEHHPDFPERTNFEIVEVLGTDHVRMRVWERGVGETQACGTGACAVGVASRLLRGAAERLAVDLPGGRLQVEWRSGESVQMTGPAQTSFTGELEV
jgi:diaminopimelate epimerase